MFKPVQVIQTVAVLILLGGCSTTPTAALPTTIAASGAPTLPTLPRPVNEIKNATDFAPIKAGVSVNNTDGFLNASGDLDANLQSYARDVSESRHLPLAHVQAILKAARYNPTVVRLMRPSNHRIRRSWFTYRNRFVEPIRIRTGVEFWTEHRAQLDRTAVQYGVPPSIIVAIIGIETVYGRQTGDFHVLDALATLGFRNPDIARPERSQLFRDQLADLIQLDYEKKLDARQVTGSYAGAIGLPQFMPGSLMRYAADGDGDGRIDLRGSFADAIASVAQFLRLHGWQPGLPVFAPVILPGNASALVVGGLQPTYKWSQLKAKGARARGDGTGIWQNYPLGVVDLLDEPRNINEFRTGTPNFFAITHYNRSYFYATSVADLARELADRMDYGGPD